MPILPVALYAAAIAAGSVGLVAMPAVVIQREGGMGIGSALIVAQAAQLGALVLGAIAGAYLIDRGRSMLAAGAAAAVLGLGLTMVAVPPSGHDEHVSLSSQVVAHTLGGAGLGLLLTAAFAWAAAEDGRRRALMIAMLLLAAPAARLAPAVVDVGDGMTLVVASVVVVAASVLAWALGRAPRTSETDATRTENASSPLGLGPAAVSGLLMAIGVFTAIAGTDASRVTVAILATPFGVTQPEVLDRLATGLVVGGLLIVVAGALALRPDRLLDRATGAAAFAVLLVALSVSATPAAAALAAPETFVPGDRSLAPISLASVIAAAAGTVLGGMWLSRGGGTWIVATTGSVVLAGAVVAVIIALLLRVQALLEPGPLVGLLGVIGLGGGLAAAALRLTLADVAPHRRGLAASMGVAAGAFGAAVGIATGSTAGMETLTGDAAGATVGMVTLAGAAVACLAAIGFGIRRSRPGADRMSAAGV